MTSSQPSGKEVVGALSDRVSGAVFVCPSSHLDEGDCKKVGVKFRNQPDSVLVLRVAGVVKAYRNQCVHMPRPLDCESPQVFDRTTGFLRCSMHGIVYSPESGESLSEICRARKLTEIRIVEIDRCLFIKDRRVKPL